MAGEERNKDVVRRPIVEVINDGKVELVDELCTPEIAPAVKAWIGPFRASFPDVHMEVVDLVAEGDKVAGRFTCSGTHEGEWRGHAPTGRRFEQVDEVYFFRLKERQDRRALGAGGRCRSPAATRAPAGLMS